jgi:hypothetical protein
VSGLVQDAVRVEVKVVDLRHRSELIHGPIDQWVSLAEPAIKVWDSHRHRD